MTMTTPELTAASYLLEQLLSADSSERIIAHGRVLGSGLAGLTVVDDLCTDDRGRPLVLELGRLWRHLVRSGDRTHPRRHTTANVRFDSRDDADGYGPAYGMGGAS